jgi:hypothetical protein
MIPKAVQQYDTYSTLYMAASHVQLHRLVPSSISIILRTCIRAP